MSKRMIDTCSRCRCEFVTIVHFKNDGSDKAAVEKRLSQKRGIEAARAQGMERVVRPPAELAGEDRSQP